MTILSYRIESSYVWIYEAFYASVSCIKMGLDPMYTKLAVVGDVNRNGSIVLAATSPLKALGVKRMARLYEIPRRKRHSCCQSNYGYLHKLLELHNKASFTVRSY